MRKTLHLLTTALLLCCFAAKAADRDTLHILCIGNSFSWDAVEQELAPICQSAGQPVLIGNLYYGGCSLEQHHRFLDRDTAAYSFRLIENGVRTIHEPYTLRQALRLCQWNYISFQQASHDSGIQSSYEPYLSQLIDSVRIYQPQAQLCWFQTWSYAQTATHPAFPRYACSQSVMNDSILACTRYVLQQHPELLLIPCGTAIQNARHTLGDTLCRDGYHLNYIYGRYTASCVWYEILTGRTCLTIPYRNADMTKKQQKQTQKAAHRAVKYPFKQKNTKKSR